jgi:hypothetical protein
MKSKGWQIYVLKSQGVLCLFFLNTTGVPDFADRMRKEIISVVPSWLRCLAFDKCGFRKKNMTNQDH